MFISRKCTTETENLKVEIQSIKTDIANIKHPPSNVSSDMDDLACFPLWTGPAPHSTSNRDPFVTCSRKRDRWAFFINTEFLIWMDTPFPVDWEPENWFFDFFGCHCKLYFYPEQSLFLEQVTFVLATTNGFIQGFASLHIVQSSWPFSTLCPQSPFLVCRGDHSVRVCRSALAEQSGFI